MYRALVGASKLAASRRLAKDADGLSMTHMSGLGFPAALLSLPAPLQTPVGHERHGER
jgi:hypothetical protein